MHTIESTNINIHRTLILLFIKARITITSASVTASDVPRVLYRSATIFCSGGRQIGPQVQRGVYKFVYTNIIGRTMTFEEFKASLAQSSGGDLPPALQALREDARGNWDAAHTIAQDIDDK